MRIFVIVSMHFLNCYLATVIVSAAASAGPGGPSGGSPASLEDWARAESAYAAAQTAHIAAPSWSLNLEDATGEDETPVGPIELTRLIARTSDSTVWEARLADGKEVIAKFINDCSLRVRHMDADLIIKSEFVLMSVANESGVTPAVYGLSAPAVVTDPVSIKAWSEVVEQVPDRCIAAGTTVRLLLQEKAGMEIGEYVKWLRARMPDRKEFLLAILALGYKTIALLDRLHSLGIMHGDIHAGNIMFKVPKSDPEEYNLVHDELVLVDLGFARFFPEEIGAPESAEMRSWANPLLASVWTLQGMRTGRRDDLYRVLDMMSSILSDEAIDSGIDAVLTRYIARTFPDGTMTLAEEDESKRRVIQHCKETYPSFLPSPELRSACCRNMGLLVKMRAPTQRRLEAVMDEVKKLSHPDAIPDYSSLIKMLRKIAKSVYDSEISVDAVTE